MEQLTRAVLEDQTEKAVCLCVRMKTTSGGESNNDNFYPSFFPKSQVEQRGKLWFATPWIIGKKEKEIAEECGYDSVKLLTGG